MHRIRIRIIIGLVLAVCVLQAWWLAALVIGLIGTWFFRDYLELVVAGIAYDALYGDTIGSGWTSHLGLFVSIIGLLITVGLKKVVRR